ncbi:MULTISPECIES: thiolase family protein [unclassified Fusibacter]|uniref:thiolase family protein n=1 Tax=unclassified Fusibacter TaxID=2624464 RepID=UPI001010EF17|nr:MULTISPECIES: thiolase family protein [unclassified Fusibacter]MCK8058082.1 thiolase family protein [Fusibacter sp. A2]NPE20664.1 thiolase family protein [Fusibacter sp. A1]RXV62870.1 thiolase family protein [Fusibacter sp. A1]
MKPVFIYKAKRTPIGKKNGSLKTFLPETLMSKVLLELLNGVEPTAVDDVIIANAVGPMGNIARLSWLEAGLPITTSATSIDFQCGGGLKAVEYAYYQIACSAHTMVIAGGTESTSLEPSREYHDNDPRKVKHPHRLTRAQFAPECLGDVDMLTGAQNTALKYDLSRKMMDDYALSSHLKAIEAQSKGIFTPLIVPIQVGDKTLTSDDSIRPSITSRLLSRAKPLLEPDSRITAGNACLMHDGAAGLLIGDETVQLRYGLKPIARIMGFSSIGCDPNLSPLGPIHAVQKLLEAFTMGYDSIDMIEINEAFSAKILAFHHATGYPLSKINTGGGALAYGHPYAASGAIILGHLIENLSQAGGRFGIAALGVAGGQGISCMIEVLS